MPKLMPTLEDRLERLEELIKLVIERLENIENFLVKIDKKYIETYRIASSLVFTFSIPVSRAIEVALKILEITRPFKPLDEISMSIIQSLSVKDRMNISELTRSVRRIRGTASRRIIINRIKKLERMGLVKVVRKKSRTWVELNV